MILLFYDEINHIWGLFTLSGFPILPLFEWILWVYNHIHVSDLNLSYSWYFYVRSRDWKKIVERQKNDSDKSESENLRPHKIRSTFLIETFFFLLRYVSIHSLHLFIWLMDTFQRRNFSNGESMKGAIRK